MQDLWTQVLETLTGERIVRLGVSFLLLLLGWGASRLLRGVFRRVAGQYLSAQHSMLGGKAIYYLGLFITWLLALDQAGVELKVLLGAAGVLTVALGFASQTSASNLISGLFMVAEKTFQVGDVIRVGTTNGIVVTIDLLSVKLRTFDNLLVRIPNESLLKSEIINLTHYPIRRLDMQIGVAYKEDLRWVEEVLREVADRNTYCLDEPKPVFLFKGFGDSAVLLQFSVWFTRETYFEAINRMQQEVKEAFDVAGIEIPFPHRSLYSGAVTEPFPVRMVT